MKSRSEEKTITFPVANIAGEVILESGEVLLTRCVIALDSIRYRVQFWTTSQDYRDVTDFDVIEERFEAMGIDATGAVSEADRKAIFERLRERIYAECESELVG